MGLKQELGGEAGDRPGLGSAGSQWAEAAGDTGPFVQVAKPRPHNSYFKPGPQFEMTTSHLKPPSSLGGDKKEGNTVGEIYILNNIRLYKSAIIK